MAKIEGMRYAMLFALVLVAILSVIVLFELASSAPDGFEWSLFEFVGIEEPEPWYAGLWSFMEEGPVTDAIAGAVGVFLVLFLAHILFTQLAKRTTA
jgi:hypothetical protein